MAGTEVDLGSFDGHSVRGTTIRITNTGDGLSKALKIDPQLLQMGDRIFVVVEAVVGPITFDPIDDDSDDVIRKHSASAQAVTLVDESLVREVLDAQIERIEAAREAESGQTRLNLSNDPDEPPEEGFVLAHVAGDHKRKKRGCPLCYPTAHGDGEGDAENPLPPATKRRSRAKGAAKKPAKRTLKSVK